MNNTLKNIFAFIGIVALVYFLYKWIFPKKYVLADGTVVDQNQAYYLSGIKDANSIKSNPTSREAQSKDCSIIYGPCWVNKGSGCKWVCDKKFSRVGINKYQVNYDLSV